MHASVYLRPLGTDALLQQAIVDGEVQERTSDDGMPFYIFKEIVFGDRTTKGHSQRTRGDRNVNRQEYVSWNDKLEEIGWALHVDPSKMKQITAGKMELLEEAQDIAWIIACCLLLCLLVLCV